MKTIMIGVPTDRFIESDTFKSIYDLEIPDGYCMCFYPYVSNQIDDIRNKIVNESKKYDYLLFVDSDMILPKDTLIKMIEADKPIISALYIQRIPKTHTLEVYMDNENNGVTNIPYELIEHRGIVEIAACGMGCCLIKTEVFHKMEYPYFVYTSAITHDNTISEDIYFCLKARRNGFTVWADETIRCDHIGNNLFKVGSNYSNITQTSTNENITQNNARIFK